MPVKYVHTNIVALNWRELARFYIGVFGCEPVYPERDLSGQWIEDVTGVKNVRIRGIHLRLPGYGEGANANGPTLEIFQYSVAGETARHPAINRPGFAHIAFQVEDVPACLQSFLQHGGSKLGEFVEHEVEGVGTLSVVYARDPEGNIVELQNWR